MSNKWILIILTVICGVSRAADKGQDICYTGNVAAEKGASFSVGVYVKNADTLAGMQIPIYYRSEKVNLRCDSVSFHNSRCAEFTIKDYRIEPLGKTIYFALIDTRGRLLAPGDGLVATLWFTVDSASPGGRVELFSGPKAYLPDEYIDFSYLFWLPSSQQIDFQYKAGYITVK